MPHTYEEVRRIASELPEDQQILLANSLWENVGNRDAAASSDPEIEALWHSEVERRVAEFEAGNGAACSWEEVESPLRARLSR
jgi:putative addiction module component (TIGR02574 family)